MPHSTHWLTTVVGLTSHGLKVGYAKSELYRHSLGDLAEALNLVCQRAESFSHAAREVLTAFVPVITDVDHLPRVASVRATAQAASLVAASRLLRCSTTDGHLLDTRKSSTDQGILQNADGRPVTLGERRALARRPSREMLDKLMRDPHPMVARIVLSNPRITEDDVLLMAARRPAVPRVAVEIAKKWTRSARVRMSIVLNPGSPPAVSVPLLSLLSRPELATVRRAADLPAVVRATAQDLHELRPPLREVEEPELKH
jgi:hypothetical protein